MDPDAQSLADWPTEPVAVTDPRVAAVAQVIKPGYSGESYLDGLVTTWGITLKARERIDFPGRPPVWHTSGVKEDGDTTMWIAAVWSLDGDLIKLACHVTAAAVKQADFLHDCAGLDYPGAEPAAAKSWLDAMEPRVDAVFATDRKVAIDSPLHRSGPVAFLLRKAPDATYGGDSYELLPFGTGSS
ncbi:hypothetical protein ACFP3U_33315 [Kitasatospora misakiensis]|uniref:Uncharacterized protein n=1 Tax=Kitasatospora misakiensis TaxID=67330 RepID=A0ABW0XHA1_9ACTN